MYPRLVVNYVAEGSLELPVLLLLSPTCWDYRPAPSHCVVTGTAPVC